ncbi:decarboxylating 6-phosphogluconate dehydrogenase [Candidatus Babeliales bacterium]|nr:decarboxylating 6-phosphogluconate dehydrogenase [Candidatus Babeliales bacterium]
MKLGVVGLGRMGTAIVKRLLKAKYKVVAYDKDVDLCKKIKRLGAEVVSKPIDLVKKTNVIWMMVPAGKVVDTVIKSLASDLKKGFILIDGGNSYFEDTVRRSKLLKKKGIHYIDCGTSGGLRGEKTGFSLMIGGEEKVYKKLKPILKAIAAKDGFEFFGPSGSGHYVKMVHNGIEYALLQSYAEGFHLLKNGTYKNLDLAKIAHVWNNGGVIRSWILSLLQEVLDKDQDLKNISGAIGENKTGLWTTQEAKKRKIPIDLIQRSLDIRSESRAAGGNYATKLVSMLRNKFGGHPVTLIEKKK